MTAVANSQLNPLADSFVPTSNQNALQGKEITQHSIKNKSKSKTTWKSKISSNWESEYEKTRVSISLNIPKRSVLNEFMALSGLSSMISLIFSSSFLGRKLCTTETSPIPVLPEPSRDNDPGLVLKSKVDLTEKQIPEGKNECNCPPMFGWVLPPEFIGNPFNYKYGCSKKYPHSPNSVEQKSDICSLDSLDKINNLTLDECYSEMKDIIADVYETISMDLDPISNWDEKYKIQDYLEVSDCVFDNGEDNESKFSSLDSASEETTNAELIDDGCHPLLQPVPAKEEDQEDFVQKVEKILGKCLSSSPESRDSSILNTGTVCDPPCSVWCEFLPESAKETFKKYVQNSKTTKDIPTVYHQLGLKQKPVYKRSFSADDASMLGMFNESINGASAEEILRRKDTLNDFKAGSNTQNRKAGSCYFSGELLGNSNTESSMWGKFDGADSLWRPLPECMPEDLHNLRTNGPKRGREVRWKRSVN